MVYVSRTAGGEISGVFARLQREIAEEELAEDAAEVVAFYSRGQPSIADRVNIERDRRIMAGTTADVEGIGPVPLQGRPQDQLNMLALKDTARDLQVAGVTSAVIPFRDGANVEHMLTAEQMVQITDQGKQHITAIYQAAWALKAMDPIPADYADDQWWP